MNFSVHKIRMYSFTINYIIILRSNEQKFENVYHAIKPQVKIWHSIFNTTYLLSFITLKKK